MGVNFVENPDFSDENGVIEKINQGDMSLIQPLFNKYYPVVLHIASQFDGFGIDKEDLIQEGLISLYSAVKIYDFSSSKFSTFAGLCIKRGMITAVRQCGNAGKIPKNLILSLDDIEIPSADDPEQSVIEKENYDNFRNGIRSLLSKLEYSVLAEYLAGNSYDAISKNLGISVKSVSNSLSRTRSKILKLTGNR